MNRDRRVAAPSRVMTVVALVVVSLALGWSIVRDGRAGSAPSAAAAPSPAAHRADPVRSTGRTTPVPAPAATAAATTTAAAGWRPCAGNVEDSLVVVSLSRQQLVMCRRSTSVDRTPVTTGMAGADNATPTGVFHIQGRNRDSLLTQADGRQYPVRYWIPFDAPAFGFHDSPWQTIPYGSSAYRTGGSHGCVHVPAGAITRLFDWVDIGTTVRIER